MNHTAKSIAALIFRLLAVLSLLGWPQAGRAAGTWSAISGGQIQYPAAVAVDTAGSLYIADASSDDPHYAQVRKRDAQGSWSVVATYGMGPGQVFSPVAVAADAAGNLYVAEAAFYLADPGRIQERDSAGNWYVIATRGTELGQVLYAHALAADAAGNLYVAEADPDAYGVSESGRIQERDARGNWSSIAAVGSDLGQVAFPTALAADAAGNFYVAEFYPNDRIQRRDAHGNWSLIAAQGSGLDQVSSPAALAVDTAGNLYVADTDPDRIQKRDAQGNWSVVATYGTALGQVAAPSALAVDATGNLYVADTGNGRVQKYTPGP